MATAGEMDWRRTILGKIKDRNRRESEAFAALVHSHAKLLESAESLKTKNVLLTVEAEKLRQENLDLQVKVEAGGGGSGARSGEKTQALEQKLFKLQEELTEAHRRKGENAQQIIDLNNALQEKEKELHAKEARIQELDGNLTAMQNANRNLEQSVIELTTTNQMLTDEQQALQMAFTSLEGKFRKLQEDNNELVCRWMALKSRDADKLNAENDQTRKKLQDKMRRELQEAARENRDVHVPDGDMVPGPTGAFCVSVSIPNKALHKLDAHEGEVNAVRWSPSGRVFATGGADRKLKLWEVVNSKCETKGILMGSNAAIMSVEFDLEENYVLAASNDFASRVWTLSDHRLRHTLTGHSGKVLAAKFLGDSTKVVSGSHDRTLKIWDLRNRACIKTLFAGSICNDLVTSDGLSTNIISGHFDRKVRFWDTRSDSSANQIHLQDKVTSLDLSPDRTSLLSCTRDDSIKLVDLRMNQVFGTLSGEGFHVGSDWSRAVFSPDGEYVMAGSQDGSLFIWNIAKSKVEKVLKEHNHAVIACSWHPNGNSLLSCDRQRKICYWSDF